MQLLQIVDVDESIIPLSTTETRMWRCSYEHDASDANEKNEVVDKADNAHVSDTLEY